MWLRLPLSDMFSDVKILWGISLFTGMPCLVYAMRGQKYRTQQGAVPEMEQAQMGAFGIGVAAPLMRTLRRSIAARNGAGVR